MGLAQKVLVSGAVILVCFMLIAQDDYRGGGALPLELLRPKYGEELCFPRDYVIGELGRGAASEEAYRYARLLAANLAAGNGTTDDVYFSEEKRLSTQRRITALGTRSWRVGGGRAEPDGAVSFLIRFLGREQSITGELYLRRAPPPVETARVAPPENAAVSVDNAARSAEAPAAPESAAQTAAAAPAAAESAAQTAVTAVDNSPGAAAVEAAANTAGVENAVPPAAGASSAAVESIVPPAAEIPALAATAAEGSPPAANTAAVEAAANTTAAAPADAAPSAVEEAPLWLVDDILLENPRGLAEGKYSPGGADMTAYERFF